MSTLEDQIAPIEFLQGATEPYIARRELIVAIAGLSMSRAVKLEANHDSGFEVVEFTLPTKIEGKEVKVFRAGNHAETGFHSEPRGGTRMHHEASPGEALDLARGMNTKFMLTRDVLRDLGVVDFDFAYPVGGKTEILTPVNARDIDAATKKNIIFEVIEGMDQRGLFDSRNHRTGPDVNMSADDMLLMRDGLVERGYDETTANSWITGKAVGNGGVEGRKTATARGHAVAVATDLELNEVGPGTKVRFSTQGFGNAGSPIVLEFNEVSEYQGLQVCISDETGSIYHPKGIDIRSFSDILFSKGSDGNREYIGVHRAGDLYLKQNPDSGALVIPIDVDPDFWLKVEADIYVPAALKNGIGLDNVSYLVGHQKAKDRGSIRVAPVANYGTSVQAEVLLEQAGIHTMHFAHTSAYGVCASLGESAVNLGNFDSSAYENPAIIQDLVDEVARRSTRKIFDVSESLGRDHKVSLAAAVSAMRLIELNRRFN